MKAKVNRNECIRCGLCAGTCPKVFKMDDEQIAKVILDPIPSEFQDTTREAANACPTGAISIKEE